MVLFKEVYCAHCGNKTNILTRSKLEDGNYVCKRCTSGLPSAIAAHLNRYDYEMFVSLLEYMYESRTYLAKIFNETHRFHSIHIDTQHKLFYLDKVYPTVYLKFENLKEFNMNFDADEVKTGMLSTKVTGKIFYKVDMSFPMLFIDDILAENVKANANIKSGLFKDKVVYDNPKGMNEFLHYFAQAWQAGKDEMYARLTRELQEEN